MTILVTGGRGKTATRLGALLDKNKNPFIVATTSTSPIGQYNTVNFDWLKPKTWKNAFDLTVSGGLEPVSAVYLVGAHSAEFVKPMLEFIDFAHSKGVNRFVLLSASNTEKGDPMMGEAHAHLDSIADVQYVVLRPTWFMESHLEDPHLSWIKDENKIYSATGQGKIPFISVDDIARVAYSALTNWRTGKAQEYLVLGPDLLSYGQVAEILSELLGRQIIHVSLDAQEMVKILVGVTGFPPEFASMLASMETAVAAGSEERHSQDVERVTGVVPQSFVNFARENRSHWISN
ncbi:hypothetical protein N7517_011613 [Penicillium concentricum]|uniref:NAD(P)-binding domain-containing protein n=1 Tax=Penicillium concentricum TaxID=293559 RepID=A0A9W9RDN6_9EURO|nr:uncharacterized protein N7517_011613 [Penicillium concentricum]KAJ5357004.1 hypothetical protein N7517_011613 [Penicillium concentricum]